MAITIKDIAKLAGVSISTVSRILNNKDGFISELTRQKVLKIVEEQNYVPNAFARSLVTTESKMLGIIVPDIVNPYFPELIRGCDDTARKYGYSVLLCNSDDIPEKEASYLDFLAQKGVDGILLAVSAIPPDVKRINKHNIPIVTLDRLLQGCSCHVGSVETDNKLGAYLSAQHLIKTGHKDIVFLCGGFNVPTSQVRYLGFQAAMHDAGLTVNPDLAFFGDFQHSFGYQKTKEILKSKTKFTAICCMSDTLALGAMAALREEKISIPDQCAVMGYDNTFVSNLIERPLSTIERNTYEMGKIGVEMLVAHINGEQKNFAEKILCTSLVIRETT